MSQEEFFLEKYRGMDTEELQQLRGGGLTELADKCAAQVLAERGAQASLPSDVAMEQKHEERVSTRWVSGRGPNKGGSGGFLLRAFLGLEPLWKVYWLAGWGGTFVVGVLVGSAANTSILPFQIAAGALAIAFIAWLLVSLWRCARNLTPRMVVFGALVQAIVIVQVIGLAAVVITRLLR